MSVTARITLPGFDVLSDTNLDHFSLYADVDNVLIKSKVHNLLVNVAAADPILGYTKYTYQHSLGYIPFFLANGDDIGSSGSSYPGAYWISNNRYNPFEVPLTLAAADTNFLYLINFDGGASHNFLVNLFYDNMSNVGTPSIVESNQVFKISRPLVDCTTSLNPNDYIMHSDLNNFRILKEGTTSLNVSAAGSGDPSLGAHVYKFAHGSSISSPYASFVFVTFPDGKVMLTGGGLQFSYDGGSQVESWIDGTYIYMYLNVPSSFTVNIKYYIIASGSNGMISNNSTAIAIAKPGFDVLKETNPDNFTFHSDFNTLKYFHSDSITFTCTNTTVQSYAHNLGYKPFFIGFVNDFRLPTIWNGNSEPVYAIAPYYLGQSSLGAPNQDIGAFVYADETNIYFKAYYQPNAVGTSKTFTFYYKVFKNNLNI